MEELAQKASLSRAAFAQRFKELLGDTPVNYVTKVRIQKAMELLVRTEGSIERIAETVGWAMPRALRYRKPLSASPGCRRSTIGYRRRGDRIAVRRGTQGVFHF